MKKCVTEAEGAVLNSVPHCDPERGTLKAPRRRLFRPFCEQSWHPDREQKPVSSEERERENPLCGRVERVGVGVSWASVT